jgi:FkbM family methyltransferase
MKVFFLKRLVLLARIFGFLMPLAIRISKEYLESQYAAALALEDGSPQRKSELSRLALLRQKIHPPTEHFLVDIVVDGLSIKANLCQQYCGDLYYGIGFERSELELVKQIAKAGDIFFDVGANIGIYTLITSKLVGMKGQVHAFEPLSEVNGLLRENVGINQCANVTINPVAVGEINGEVPIYVNVQNALSSLGNTRRGRILKLQNVPIVTLDGYAETAGISKIDFLKIDVEGFEGHVLRGAEKLLENSQDLVVMSELAQKNFAPLGFSVKEVLDWMFARGFVGWMIEDNALNLHPVSVDMRVFSFQNFIFIRPGTPKFQQITNLVAALPGGSAKEAHDLNS